MISSISSAVASSGYFVVAVPWPFDGTAVVGSIGTGCRFGDAGRGSIGTGCRFCDAGRDQAGARVDVTVSICCVFAPGLDRRGGPRAGKSSCMDGACVLGAGVGVDEIICIIVVDLSAAVGMDLGAAVGRDAFLFDPLPPANNRMPLLVEVWPTGAMGAGGVVTTSGGAGGAGVGVVDDGVGFPRKKFRIPLRKPGLGVVVTIGCSVDTTKCGRINTCATSACAYDSCCKFCAPEIRY